MGALLFFAYTPAKGQQEFASASNRIGPLKTLSTASKTEMHLAKLNQVITIEIADQSMRQALQTISSRARVQLIFADQLLDRDQRVNLELTNVTVLEALHEVLRDSNLRLMLSPSGNLLLAQGEAAAPPATQEAEPEVVQTGTIAGVVTDAAGETLPGASVIVVGTPIGASTDMNGRYQLTGVAPGVYSVQASFIGYQTQVVEGVTVTADQTTPLDFVMTSAQVGLDELIVVGYGEVRRRDLTGAISSIQGRDIAALPVYSIENALQGQAAGVEVSADGFAPGAGSTIRIRGTRSMSASNNPLFIVDGVPVEGGLMDLNTSNIESIEILKDASATAIYGSRGANGVILITSQRGYEGRTSVQLNSFAGVQSMSNGVQMMSGERYAEMKRQAEMVQGTYTTDEALFEPWELQALREGRNTDWQALMYGTGYQQNHNLTISGGDQRSRFFISGSASDHEAIAPNNDYARYTARLNFDHTAAPWLRFDVSSHVSTSTRHLGGSFSRVRVNPLAEPFDEEGNPIFYPAFDPFQESPLFDLNRDNFEDQRRRTRVIGNVSANMRFTDHLSYRLSFAPDFTFGRDGRFRGSETISQGLGPADARVQNRQTASYLVDNIVEYRQVLADRHRLHGTLLYGYQWYTDEFASVHVEELPYEHQRYFAINTAERTLNRSSSLNEWALQSFMARLNYGFDDRYLFTLTGRLDGSSRLAPGRKYGFFPSAAFAWRAIDEAFMQNQGLFSDLRLRLSYGQSGNTAIQPYQTQGSISRIGYNFGPDTFFGFQNNEIPNPDLRWETTAQIDIGLDFGFLDNRVTGVVDVYRSNTFDLLMPRQLPPTSGYSSIIENVGSTRNTGVELTLSTINARTRNFNWSTDLTFSRNRNEIVELYGGTQDDPGNNWFIGHPIQVHYDYQFGGIWQLGQEAEAALFNAVPGDMRVVDVNGDGAISDLDRVILGSPFPGWTGGLTNRFSYGGVDLSFLVYTAQDVLLNSSAYATGLTPLRARYNSLDVDFWTPTNPSNEWPRPRYERHAYEELKAYVDGYYVRVRNITLGYRLPANLMRQMNVLASRIYVAAHNPFTFTSFQGYDPEGAVGTQIPNYRTFLIGLDISL